MSTTVNNGTSIEVYNFTLSSSADTQIVINDKDINTFVIRCRSAIDLYLKSGAGATNYYTIPSGTSLTLSFNARTLAPFSLKAASSTPEVEIVGIRE